MSGIPDDIRATARATLEACLTSDVEGDGDEVSIDAIARAILAERERCANIVFRQFAPNQGESVDPVGIELLADISGL